MFKSKELNPTATLLLLETFAPRESLPIAIFCVPVLLMSKAEDPIATLLAPVVLALRAVGPKTTFVATEPAPRPTLTEFTAISELKTSKVNVGAVVPPIVILPVS